MSDDKLPPMPEPFTQEPELYPGGVDAVPDDPEDEGLSRDLDPDENPAVDDVLPQEVAERDDKKQEPDNGDDKEAGTERQPDTDEADDSTGEPEAGQEAEDGSVEPPA